MGKGIWGTVPAWLFVEISTLFPHFWWCTCPWPLKCPLLSSLQGESGFRAWALPFPVLHQWRNLLLCFAKPGLLRLKGVVTGKGRTQMGSTHPRRLVTKAEVGGTLRAFGGKQPWFQTFSLWNRERIKFCCFKPPGYHGLRKLIHIHTCTGKVILHLLEVAPIYFFLSEESSATSQPLQINSLVYSLIFNYNLSSLT